MDDPNYEIITMFALAFDCSHLIITTYVRLSAAKLKKDQLMFIKKIILTLMILNLVECIFKSSEFKDAVFNKKVFRHPMKKLSSKNHKIYTQESNKVSLSCFDDKRHFKDDGINTLAHGHKDIQIKLKKNFFS